MRSPCQASSGGQGWSETVDVAVSASGNRVEAVVDGRELDGTLRRTGDHGGFLETARGVHRIHWSRDASGIWVTVDGRTVLFRQVSTSGAAAEAGSLASPMPARVLRVDVAVGDEVEAGQTLMVLEAMKMEHALKAPSAGKVTALHAAADDQVAAGVTLVDIE